MVVTMPEASHASRRRRRAAGAGGAGRGGMACARGGSARSTAGAPPARNTRRESRERAVQQTNRRYSRCGDSASSARAKCGHRVLPPFVRFSAVFAGRARTALCAAVDDPRPRAALAPGTAAHLHRTYSRRTPLHLTPPCFHLIHKLQAIEDCKLCLDCKHIYM